MTAGYNDESGVFGAQFNITLTTVIENSSGPQLFDGNSLSYTAAFTGIVSRVSRIDNHGLHYSTTFFDSGELDPTPFEGTGTVPITLLVTGTEMDDFGSGVFAAFAWTLDDAVLTITYTTEVPEPRWIPLAVCGLLFTPLLLRHRLRNQ